MTGMSRPHRPTRRRVLAGSLSGLAGAALGRVAAVVGVAGGAAGVGALAGCTRTPAPVPPDPLRALTDAALADAALADAVAAAHPGLAPAAHALAADRRAHADSLGAEVLRATPSPRPSTSAATAVRPAPADPAAATAELVATTKAAQEQAGDLVAGLPRYRAGLVASVAACCASHLAVLA
jgi:hypothetical protein